jgi:hypothetical protein
VAEALPRRQHSVNNKPATIIDDELVVVDGRIRLIRWPIFSCPVVSIFILNYLVTGFQLILGFVVWFEF